MTAPFVREGKHPKTVIVIHVGEVYFQCAKALMRSELWTAQDDAKHAPTAGQFVKELQDGFDAEAYDQGYAAYAKDRMW